jgi:hypothetical protein
VPGANSIVGMLALAAALPSLPGAFFIFGMPALSIRFIGRSLSLLIVYFPEFSLLLEAPEPPLLDVLVVPGDCPIAGIFALFLMLTVPPVFCIDGTLALSVKNVFLSLDISSSP